MRLRINPDAERRLLNALRDTTRPARAARLRSVVNAIIRDPGSPGFRYRSYTASDDRHQYRTYGFDAGGEPWFIIWRIDRERDELWLREIAPGDRPF